MGKISYSSGEILGEFGCIFQEEVLPVKYKGGRLRRRAAFKCPCGEVFTSLIDSVKSNKTKSCGCLNAAARVKTGKAKKTHGLSKTKLYNCWTHMKGRCYNPNNQDYQGYGGRGIGVCDRWKVSFENFRDDMGNDYQDGLEIDRIDVNRGYAPDNCRWTTEQTQAWNQRRYKNNSSGKTGVTWNAKSGKWEARISKDGVEYYLGFYEYIEDAIKCRECAELEFYGHTKE